MNKYLQDFLNKISVSHPGYKLKDNNDYKTMTKLVTFLCDNNHEFECLPKTLISGKKCPECEKLNNPAFNEYLNKANVKFPDLYDYSKYKYVNSNTTGDILCKKCNKIFRQTMPNHLSGNGCPECFQQTRYNVAAADSLGSQYPGLVAEYHINNDKTIFEIPVYYKTPVLWKCLAPNSNHPDYYALTGNKVKGTGCPLCSGKKLAVDITQTNPWVINEWDNQNDKTPDNYTKNSKQIVWWKCPKCGVSYQKAINSRCVLANYKNHCPNC